MKKVSSSKFYGIGHVLSKIEVHETPKSFKVGYTINRYTTFKFQRTKFHRVVWALEYLQ